jgi:hypothetical protein
MKLKNLFVVCAFFFNVVANDMETYQISTDHTDSLVPYLNHEDSASNACPRVLIDTLKDDTSRAALIKGVNVADSQQNKSIVFARYTNEEQKRDEIFIFRKDSDTEKLCLNYVLELPRDLKNIGGSSIFYIKYNKIKIGQFSWQLPADQFPWQLPADQFPWQLPSKSGSLLKNSFVFIPLAGLFCFFLFKILRK